MNQSVNGDGHYRPFEVHYGYLGRRWAIEIMATSFEDAEARVRALAFARLGGEIVLHVPVAPRTGWLNRLVRRLLGAAPEEISRG
ncbi:hypothetical protein SAMN02745194_04518 [Roseomonas rosea]|uniref:Uncharacterized protein n=1 Tax=Muricoccus roseus TaxID=198092 RepID=A0A1M6QUJ2_9PROT|nr:hypothetical protein [Roseomonas rosea]SHK23780.1 hypothetical protein SAMN02745194_04518 [Roseomonas rosea]